VFEEVELVREMVHSNKLQTDQMLIIDGSLQFSDRSAKGVSVGVVGAIEKNEG
jgi:hypothetical protein